MWFIPDSWALCYRALHDSSSGTAGAATRRADPGSTPAAAAPRAPTHSEHCGQPRWTPPPSAQQGQAEAAAAEQQGAEQAAKGGRTDEDQFDHSVALRSMSPSASVKTDGDGIEFAAEDSTEQKVQGTEGTPTAGVEGEAKPETEKEPEESVTGGAAPARHPTVGDEIAQRKIEELQKNL
eukprot:gene35215-58215_t